MNNDNIIDKMTKVCVCKSISRLTIKNAIREQKLKTVSEVFQAVGAGSGSCHGRTCSEKIQILLDEMNGNC